MFKTIILYYVWPNTAGNHAGMAYFARALKSQLSLPILLIKAPDRIGRWNWRLQRLWQIALVSWLMLFMREDDLIFFMEYLGGRQCGDHRAIAMELRKRGTRNRMLGLVHLPPQSLEFLYDREYILSGLSALDDIIVFGSSLEKYFVNLGFGPKVKRTFHYVDKDYYRPRQRRPDTQFTVIASGSLLRNHQVLREIVMACPEIHFDICMGKADLRSQFVGLANTFLHPYMPEADLLHLTQDSDASLSVLDDTLGSNVIVTSMACGLPQVVSEVGSIRDYCSEENAIFCKTTQDYVSALRRLQADSHLRERMDQAARQRAEELSLARSVEWFQDLFFEQ